MSASLPPAPINTHGDSLRVGIRLAALRYTSKIPADDVVEQIAKSRPPNVILNEFPLDVIAQVPRERQERRRVCARDALIVMLHHAGDPLMLTQSDIEKLTIKAWQLAAAMESQEDVSYALGQLTTKDK
jgi:hypothetical protein